MTKGMFRCIASILTLCLCLFTVACATFTSSDPEKEPPESTATPAAYLAIDINPSVELLIENGEIADFRALNDDAEVLLSGESLTGLTVEEATERVVALAEEMGYLNDENTEVKLTVAADDEALTAEIEAAADSGARRGSDKAEVKRDPRSADIRTVKALQAEDPTLYKNLTPAKVRLIEAIMELDDTMTFEQGAAMKVQELSHLLKSLADDLEDIVGDEMEQKFKDRVSELRSDVEAKIAAIYGEEYLAKWEQYNALAALAHEIEQAAEHCPLSEEDLAALGDLITGVDPHATLPEGVIAAEELEEWLDRLEDRLPKEAEEQVKDGFEAVLDRYDEDDYLLTEADLAAITEILGSAPNLTTLEELENYLDTLEEELETLRESIELTEEQKAAIKAFKSEISSLCNRAREELKDDIAAAKTHFADLKKEKLPR